MKEDIKFKVGDHVTPDPKMLTEDFVNSGPYRNIENVYTVTEVRYDSITLDRPIEGSRSGWLTRYWKLAKNHNILEIINNL